MRKFLISLAAAGTALTIASPAAAQYYPQPQGYGYGYNNPYNHGQTQRLMARVDQLAHQVSRLHQRGQINNREASTLHQRAMMLRNRLMQSAYNGLNRRERQIFASRINRLQAQISSEAREGRRWGRNDNWGGRGRDRDRDGRDDRWEDDRGWDHD